MGMAEFHYGFLFNLKGDGENAVKHFQSSIGYLEESQAVVFLPGAWANLGWGYFFLGELNTALKFIEKGLKIQMDTGIHFSLSNYHCDLSFVHFDLGNLSGAKLHAEKALDLAQTNHEKCFEGVSWIQLGRTVAKLEKSRIDKAEEYILKGMKILDELELKAIYALGYLFLGELYANAGQKEKAHKNLKKAEAMYQEMGMDHRLARTRKLMETLL
jgi:tetratricopeptide (TPR) repeat protein